MKATPLLDAFEWSQFERVIVLSPHLDDAALSCGGLLASLQGSTETLVITIACADPSRPRKGFAPVDVRRAEDARAMASIDTSWIHLGFDDAIYRRSPATGDLIYLKPREKWGGVQWEDAAYVEELYVVLRRLCTGLGRVLLLSPMAVGFHVDHSICARVALRLARGKVRLLFYEDFPYVVDAALGGGDDDPLRALRRLGLEPVERYFLPIDVEQKARLLEAYVTQVLPLFGDVAMMSERLRARTHQGRPAEFLWRARTRPPERNPS